MSMTRQIVAWVYGLQLFIVLPWFLGAIDRHEQSLWMGQEFVRALHRFGLGDALLSAYLYLLFYSAFFVLPQCAFHSASISIWFAFTCFLFFDSIMGFVHGLPTDDWRCYLILPWAFACMVAYEGVKRIVKPKVADEQVGNDMTDVASPTAHPAS
jgi:hypothetical protein